MISTVGLQGLQGVSEKLCNSFQQLLYFFFTNFGNQVVGLPFDRLHSKTKQASSFWTRPKICNFEDFCVLNPIGTFILHCKLAKNCWNGPKVWKRQFKAIFETPHSQIVGSWNFCLTLKVANIWVCNDRLYRTDRKNYFEVYFTLFRQNCNFQLGSNLGLCCVIITAGSTGMTVTIKTT